MLVVLYENLKPELQTQFDHFAVTDSEEIIAKVVVSHDEYRVIKALVCPEWEMIDYWNYKCDEFGVSNCGEEWEADECFEYLRSIINEPSEEYKNYVDFYNDCYGMGQ